MDNVLKNLASKALERKKTHRQTLEKLKRKRTGKVDKVFHQLHNEAFACIDCLQCANCCKTTGPLFTQKDITRISGHLNLSESEFSAKYLRIDEDNDHVLQKVPCVFLDAENYCSIYEVRPKACREYPHTDMSKQQKIFNLTLKNAEICPAVFQILERLSAVDLNRH